MGAGTSGASPVFNSTAGVTDSLARDQLSRVALSTGDATTDEYDQAVADLEAEQARLDGARQAAADKAEQIKSTKAATDQQAAEYTQARQDAEAKLGQLVKEEEERRARESYLKMQREAEEAAGAPARRGGGGRGRPAAGSGCGRAAGPSGGPAAGAAATAVPPAGAGGVGAGRHRAGSPQRGAGGPQRGAGGPQRGSRGAGGRPVAASDPEPAAIPAASSRAGTAIQAALSVLGTPYVGYKASPSEGFDCSGLTMWAWAQAGVSLPHQSKAQYASLPHVPTDQAQPGDLLFFHSPISHVSMYLGGGQQIHAPATGQVVKVGPVNWGKVVGVARPG